MSKKNNSVTELPRNGSKRPNGQLAPADSKDVLMKVPKAGIRRKEAALGRLGVNNEQILQCPPLSPIFGHSKNINMAIDSLRFSADPVATKFLAVHDKIPVGDRKYLTDVVLEAVSVKAGLKLSEVNELLGAMVRSFQQIQVQKSAMLAMAEHPGIVRKTIDFAKLPRHDRDRKMMHEAVRFIPTPVGSTVNVFPQHQDDKPRPEDDASPDVNEVFPLITDSQQEWQDRRQKVLAAKN